MFLKLLLLKPVVNFFTIFTIFTFRFQCFIYQVFFIPIITYFVPITTYFGQKISLELLNVFIYIFHKIQDCSLSLNTLYMIISVK